ncbi:TRAP transporter substrate-binding protein [Aquibium carbonis]|uniref:TRAP transporter substrate-binding protein n=1 Tax=Aquibium carbonis TaxID=2495581 RepID=A0A3R9YAM7_9HYPH|nr:TRAP transporter substrate-binding protein [Aquibium carbonis]RST86932.1 TRAP transporter substrate-binding protein [Aquibium carbonis]
MKSTILRGLALALGTCVFAGSAMAEFKDRTIRISNGVAETHPVGSGVTAMKECLTEKSGGKMKVNAFWSGALGGDLDATQALRSGTQEMVVTSSSPLVGILPALGVFDLPFLFADETEADTILDGDFGAYVSDMMPGVGLINLAYWENGFRNLTNSQRPVAGVDDIKGLKVRVMQNNIFLDSFLNLGANAVPMSFGEVFTALETGAIDGQENPVVTIDTSKFSEVQKHLTMSRHAYTPFMVLYSKPLWDQLSADEQAALQECAIVGRDAQRKASRDLGAQSLENVKAAGMEVVDLTPEAQAAMREAVAPVYEKHAATIGQEVVDKMMAELKKMRGE